MQQLQISVQWSTTSKIALKNVNRYLFLTILNACITLGPLNMQIPIEIAQYGKDINFSLVFERKKVNYIYIYI